MADNTSLNPGVGGDIIATDDIAGVKYQRTKVVWGVDGVANDASATNPLPVALVGDAGLTDAQLRATAVPVSGTVAVSNMVAQGLTDTQIRATALPVSGTVAVSNMVAQGITDTQIRATALPVSGSFFQATQPVSGAFFQTTQPVSGAFFQATQPISGTVLMPPVTPVTILSVANTTATLNLPAPAAGLFHYITRIRIALHNTSGTAVAGSAVTLGFTTTNIPGALGWTDGNALAAGTSKTVTDEHLHNALKSTTAATATTIVAPAAGAGVVCRLTAYFYTGP